MARKILAFISTAVVLALCACPLAAAQEGGWRVEIPLEGLPARLDRVDSGKTLDLIAVADGSYTFALVPLRMEGKSWVRAVLTKGTGFFGMCMLATREAFGKMEALAVDIAADGVLRFSALPEGEPLAAFEVPLNLEGECRLLPLAQSQGVTITPVDAPSPDNPDALPADASAAEDGEGGPPPLRLPTGTYALALLAVIALLAALVLGYMHRRRIKALTARVKKIAIALRTKKPVRVKKSEPSAPMEDTREIPRIAQGPYLPGLRVVKPGEDALVRQITMRTAWEAAVETAPGIAPEQVSDYFLGRGGLPAGGRFRTVGLRNREALQQLGGGVRPLFGPNPRGQIFSLEEETGDLYLHVDYFAPPSFLLQPVLRSVCLECVFALEDARGNPLRLENVLGHAILGIVPARTAYTQSGFIVTERGRLVIGEN